MYGNLGDPAGNCELTVCVKLDVRLIGVMTMPNGILLLIAPMQDEQYYVMLKNAPIRNATFDSFTEHDSSISFFNHKCRHIIVSGGASMPPR